jgi:hypothetical protein
VGLPVLPIHVRRQAVPVTDAELKDFLKNTPKLYHMAEFRSWPSIRERGLLSTSAILDLYGVQGDRRCKIEEEHRSESVFLSHQILPPITIRDQIPMNDHALRKCLLDGLQPSDWYRLLNNRVFFWPSRERLLRFLKARAYHGKKHDVLEIDAAGLFEAYADAITLSPINSGSATFNPRSRGKKTFSRISDYAYAERPSDNRVAEVAVAHSVPDISKYVTRVLEMLGTEEV